MRQEFLRHPDYFDGESFKKTVTPGNKEIKKLWDRLSLNYPTDYPEVTVETILETALELLKKKEPISSRDAAELVVNYSIYRSKKLDNMLNSPYIPAEEKLTKLIDIREMTGGWGINEGVVLMDAE